MLRRKVAERLVSKNETAMLTTFNEVNMTPINLIRNEYKETTKHAGVSLGYMSFFTKAVTRALKLYPDKMDGDYKIAYDFCDNCSFRTKRTNGSCCS
jgi:2-oxoglutarate dehydrogenase E2 component (dihydrolipoamide succinyltransferase)